LGKINILSNTPISFNEVGVLIFAKLGTPQTAFLTITYYRMNLILPNYLLYQEKQLKLVKTRVPNYTSYLSPAMEEAKNSTPLRSQV